MARKTSHRVEVGSFGAGAGTGTDPVVMGMWAGRKELLEEKDSGAESTWRL